MFLCYLSDNYELAARKELGPDYPEPADVLFINAADHFAKGKRRNQLRPEDIDKIVHSYQHRTETPRYVSTAIAEEEVDLTAVHSRLVEIEKEITKAKNKRNDFLRELGLPLLPDGGE